MLKYRIKEWIAHRGHNTRAEMKELREKLCVACNIRPETLCHWERILITDKKMIPADQLLIIAQVLQVDINQFFNQQLQAA